MPVASTGYGNRNRRITTPDEVFVVHLSIALLALAPLPALAPDTPPPLPVPVERLSELKSREDLIAASRLADGSRVPGHIELPHISNRVQVLKYMIDHYPLELRDRYDMSMPWVWLFIDNSGAPGEARIVKTSGRAAFDSLALAALRVARFTPASLAGRKLGVWVPMPVEIAYHSLADRAPRESPGADKPYFTPFTEKPVLQNASEVRRALVENYPPLLRDAGIGGEVGLWILIDKTGSIGNALVKSSSGRPELDEAALAVAATMRWSPARNRGEAVDAWINVPIVFQTGTPRR